MKKYRITVNESIYEVEVEELQSETGKPADKPIMQTVGSATAPVSPKPAAQQPKQQAKKPTPSSGAVTSPMPGTILDVKVKEGDIVKKGQVLMVLEAMKMENEIMASLDGQIKTVYVQKGASVNTGDPLVEIS